MSARGIKNKPVTMLHKTVNAKAFWGVSGKLKSHGFADRGIIPIINEINDAGIETYASCSGLTSDHHGRSEGSYLSIVIPESKYDKDKIGRDSIFDLPEDAVKDKAWVRRMIAAGRRAGWNTEKGKYLVFFPDISFHLPITGSVEKDDRIKRDKRLVALNEKLHAVLGDTGEFIPLLAKRDAYESKLTDRYGMMRYNDAEKMRRWNSLRDELVKFK